MNAQTTNRFPASIRGILPSISLLLMLCLLLTSCENGGPFNRNTCKKDECGEFPNCVPCVNSTRPDEKGSTAFLDKDQIDIDGDADTDKDGFYLPEGEITIHMPAGCSFTLKNAQGVTASFGSADNLISMEGRAQIPSPNDCIAFKDPVQFKLGFYDGLTINHELDLGFTLPQDSAYFMFFIEVGVEMEICTNSSNTASKPLSLSAPVGGKLVYVMDCADPFVYLEAEQDLLGAFAKGASRRGQIGYEALLPDARIKDFAGNSIRKGTISFPKFDIIEAKDVIFIQNTELDASLLEDPLGGNLSATYRAGMNGKMNFVLSAAGFMKFTVPVGEGSAAFETTAGLNGLQAKAFVRGAVDPDLSWWPNILPVNPDGSLEAHGYLQQDGEFELGMEGDFALTVPNNTLGVSGSFNATNNLMGLSGTYENKGKTWGASAAFRENETEVLAIPPADLVNTNGVKGWLSTAADEAIASYDQKKQDLEDEYSQYQFELSLRGLRDQVRPKIDQIISMINSEKTQAISEINTRINNQKPSGGSICEWLSRSPTSYVNSQIAPYINALNRIKNALNGTQDDAQTRLELEAALRDLIQLRKLNLAYTFRFRVKVAICLPKVYDESFSREITVLNNSVIDLLTRAADNVPYIQPAADRYFQLKDIFDLLPTEAQFTQLKNDIQSGILTPSVASAGYRKDHNTGTYTFFVNLNGNEVPMLEINPFDDSALGGEVLRLLL